MQYDTTSFREKVSKLFKIRLIMKENMTALGAHDSDPYNFVQAAMKIFFGFSKILVHYFFIRCEEHIDIDTIFSPFLDPGLKGSDTSSNYPDTPESHEKSPTGKRSRTELVGHGITKLVRQGDDMLALMTDAAKDRKTRNNF
jgi:hypothetical protein